MSSLDRKIGVFAQIGQKGQIMKKFKNVSLKKNPKQYSSKGSSRLLLDIFSLISQLMWPGYVLDVKMSKGEKIQKCIFEKKTPNNILRKDLVSYYWTFSVL